MKIQIIKMPKAENGLVIEHGGEAEMKSTNPFGGGTIQFNGQSHDQSTNGDSGIGVSWNGERAEVEGGETAFKDQQGDLKIMGNLVNPLTGRKYKDDLKKIAKKEQKAQKFLDKGTLLLNTANPDDPWEALAFNAGKAMTIGGTKKQKQLSEIKEHLGNMQEAHLETAKEKKMSPEKMFAKGGTVPSVDVNTGEYYNTRLGLDNNNKITPLPTEEIEPITQYERSLNTYKNFSDKLKGPTDTREKYWPVLKTNRFILQQNQNRPQQQQEESSVSIPISFGEEGSGGGFIESGGPVTPPSGGVIVPNISSTNIQTPPQNVPIQEPVKSYQPIENTDYPIRGPLPKSQAKINITPSYPTQDIQRIEPQQAQKTSTPPAQASQQAKAGGGEGQIVYGPSNGAIGTMKDGVFTPIQRRDHLSKSNQQDIDLLNNPEALKKYVDSRPRYKYGGTIQAKNGGTMYANGGTVGDPVLFVYKGKKYTMEELKRVTGLSHTQIADKIIGTKDGDPEGITRYETEYKRVSDGSIISEYEINNFTPGLQAFMRKQIANGDYILIPNDLPRYEGVKNETPATKQTSDFTPINTTGDPIYEAMVKKAAEKYGVSYDRIKRMVELESGFVPGQESKIVKKGKQVAGALGLMQMMEATGKDYGLTRNELLSKDPKDIEKQIEAGVKHFAYLKKKFNNNEDLATYAYNMGEGNLMKFVKSSGKKLEDYTVDDLNKRMEWKRANQPTDDPNAAQNQTYDYYKNTMATAIPPEQFREQYYNQTPRPTDGMFSGKFKVPPFDYTPKPTDIQTVQGDGSPINLQQPPPINKPSNARGISPSQFLGEGYALATNREEPVQAQLYTPELFQPYQVSFQDRLNENQATFNSVEKQLAYDPTSLATLAGQKYSADSGVLAEEFRTNQSVANDITNKNVSLLNEAERTNLGILDQQYTRQTQAKANTKRINQDALSSISSKMLQNEASNRQLRVYENLYQNYSFDPHTGKALFQGPKQGEEKPIDYGNLTPITAGQPAKTVVKTSPTGQKTTTETYTVYDPNDPNNRFMESLGIMPKQFRPKKINLTKAMRAGF